MKRKQNTNAMAAAEAEAYEMLLTRGVKAAGTAKISEWDQRGSDPLRVEGSALACLMLARMGVRGRLIRPPRHRARCARHSAAP